MSDNENNGNIPQNIAEGKQWTSEDKLNLYKLVVGKGKTWKEHSEMFGVSPDACRKKFNNTNWTEFFTEEGLNESAVVKDALKEYRSDTILQEETQNLIKETREKILRDNDHRTQKELIKKAAITELIVEKIESSVARVPPIQTSDIEYPEITTQHRPQEACLVFSDAHIGLACIPEEVGYLGHYNIDVFKSRLKNLINNVIKITEYHRKSYQIDTLNIFMLGDNVHGSNDAGKWGYLHTEQNIMDQIFLAVKNIGESILTLKKAFKKIKVHCVYGNHGRIAKPNIEKSFCNWDYIVYKFLESSLELQEDIEFNIPKAPFQVANVLGHKFLLIHGDQVKMWNGIPFYGMIRAEARYKNMLSSSKNMEDLMEGLERDRVNVDDPKAVADYALNYAKPFDYLVMGHFHQPAEIPSSGGLGKLILNDSFVGGDDYTINKLLISGTATQKFFGVHVEGRSWTYDIQLDRE